MVVDVSYGSIDTPIGTYWAAVGERGVVRSGIDEAAGFAALLVEDRYAPHYEPDDVRDVLDQVDEYFAGARRAFQVGLDLRRFTPFQQEVFRAVARIPYGQTRSYRDVAEAVGRPLAARAVGGAIAANAISLLIPCHRVVKADGRIGYYAREIVPDRDVPLKRELLAREGVRPGKGLAY